MLFRSRYGVRIYEYTPGFIHAKQWVCDNELSVVGTINMDFRSLYLHFENAVMVYGKETAADIMNDFYNIFKRSEEVTGKYTNKPKILKIHQCILRLLAPLF